LTCPWFLQTAPDLTAAKAGIEREEPINARAIKSTKIFFMTVLSGEDSRSHVET
jgi:hypothetical protein